MSKKRKLSRRKFLGEASCAALGSTTFLSSFLQLGMINTVAGSSSLPSNDYKALVCILLAGGIDSHNVLVPMGNADNEYNEYLNTRGNLAISQASILPISHQAMLNGRTYGVNPAFSGIQSLFDAGNAAFISNVGTLVEPVANESEYDSGLKNLPLGLYSHSDQIMQWQTSVPQSQQALGWGGRAADILKDMNSIDTISMNVSLSGTNLFQTGNQVTEFSIKNNTDFQNVGIESFPHWWSDSAWLTHSRNMAIDSLVADVYSNLFQQTYANLGKTTLESIEILKNALQMLPTFTTNFSGTNLSQDMKMIANLIGIHEELGFKRQIFFTTIGGWDYHDNVLVAGSGHLAQVNNAMSELYSAISELGLENNVTAFTISDFARTLTSNGNGSDHAWAGNQIIVGGAVNGSQIYGDYPSLDLNNNPLNVSSRGRMIPQMSTDEVFAELALWFGVQPSDLSYVLPNITNFYNPNSGTAPVGFMNIT